LVHAAAGAALQSTCNAGPSNLLPSNLLRSPVCSSSAVLADLAAETAASCGGVELECFFLLCGHVASGSRDRALVAATLDWLAACLGYPHRHAYAAWHQRGLLFEWVSNNWSLLAWCNVQTLVAPTPKAAAADTSAFLAACAPTLTAMLVWGERQMELAAVAEQLRVGEADACSAAWRSWVAAFCTVMWLWQACCFLLLRRSPGHGMSLSRPDHAL
jgi:hypothetical protein